MDRLKLIFEEILKQFGQIESLAKAAVSKIPIAGPLIADHIRLAIIMVLLLLTIIFIKPFIKWAIIIGVIGGLVAVAISLYFDISFVKIFPYAAIGVSILLLSTK
jgi:hypothetical protein